MHITGWICGSVWISCMVNIPKKGLGNIPVNTPNSNEPMVKQLSLQHFFNQTPCPSNVSTLGCSSVEGFFR